MIIPWSHLTSIIPSDFTQIEKTNFVLWITKLRLYVNSENFRKNILQDIEDGAKYPELVCNHAQLPQLEYADGNYRFYEYDWETQWHKALLRVQQVYVEYAITFIKGMLESWDIEVDKNGVDINILDTSSRVEEVLGSVGAE